MIPWNRAISAQGYTMTCLVQVGAKLAIESFFHSELMIKYFCWFLPFCKIHETILMQPFQFIYCLFYPYIVYKHLATQHL